ncbi:unnamed protein product, partial [Mesorhabditis spiculigera]
MIFICLAISGFSLYKILVTPQQNDITGYSPYGARANDEYDAYQKYFSAAGLPVATHIFAVAKDNGSMIREKYLEELITVINYVYNNITMYNGETGKFENFQFFCKDFCEINEPVRSFHFGYQLQKQLIGEGQPLNPNIKPTYPIAEMLGTPFSLQPNFFGIEKYPEEDKALKLLGDGAEAGVNQTDLSEDALRPLITNLKSVKMIALQFRAEHKPGWTDHDVKEWEMKVVDIFQKKYRSNRLKLYVYSQSYVEEEMVRGGIIMLPYLVVGFTIMCAVSVCTVSIRAWYMNQTNCYKIVLAIMACLTPILACTTALALMFTCGIRFASILCVIPFLVLSIGVDSSYLMIHEWQRVTKHTRDNPPKKDSVGHRMSEVLSEVGPAILISCLTNMFADFVGSFTSSPEITLLCTGNMLSMWFAFIYQLTFYAGLMSIVGRYEIDEDKEEEVTMNTAEQRVYIARHHTATRQLTRQPSKFHEVAKPVTTNFFTRYVNLICNPVTYFSVVALYMLYLAVSVWGITQMNINLTARKLFALDSPLVELDDLRVQYQVPYYSQATVFVNHPGNLSDPIRLKRLNQFVADFEDLPGSWGPVGTKYFLRDFQRFENKFHLHKGGDDADGDGGEEAGDEEPEDSEEEDDRPIDFNDPTYLNPTLYLPDQIDFFISWPDTEFWKGFVKLTNATEANTTTTIPGVKVLKKFFFTTGFHGKQLRVWINRGKMLHQWRDVVDKYPDFEPSVFHEDGIYLDLIDNMPTDTWQSVAGTLVCMAAVCFVFLNSWFTVAIASLSVLSICAGILGILSWWNIDLDPITMAAMIISIGFSVDIPAHVAYHYYQAGVQHGPTATPADRLSNCLSSVAFPALQAALSTILCVCSLLFVNIYMAEVFVKTMVLCVLLCNLHGLLFLPAILITLDEMRVLLTRKSVTQQSSMTSRSTPVVKGQNNSRENKQRGRIAPERSNVTDRPEV